MYLWRNLPKGQLSAVLRWVCDARTPAATVTKPEVPAPLPVDPGRSGQSLPR